ncbi:MAG: hypothetical protein RBR65_04540 [Aliarcobacter sp.]|jgi:citrate lyase alpha subunit|nr:hypothetical protein [Aliarcobacter sp.]
MCLTKEQRELITKNVQASISLDWIIDLSSQLGEVEYHKILLDMKKYYDNRAITILKESNKTTISVYPTQNRIITLNIKT